MQKLFHTVIDRQGRPVEGATATVTQYPGGAAAAIYSDNGSTLITGNVLTTDVDGFFQYYAANGHYTWVIKTNSGEKTINDILHGDP